MIQSPGHTGEDLDMILRATHKSGNNPTSWRLREGLTLGEMWDEKPAMLHSCNPSTWEVDAEGSGVQSHPWPHSKFKVILGCLMKKQEHEGFGRSKE